MPEGDTIYGAAQRIRNALVGKEIASIETHSALRAIAGPSGSADAPFAPWSRGASTCSSASTAT